MPVLLAPMAGACPVPLSAAIANVGGLGACSALLMQPVAILEWAAAALLLSASAVRIGAGFPRCPEAKLHPAWVDALGRTPPEGTLVSRAFSGRAGRSIATAYALAATAPDAPVPAPCPVQRGLTQAMRDVAGKIGDVERMQAWAGRSAMLARAEPAGNVVVAIWNGALALLRWTGSVCQTFRAMSGSGPCRRFQ